jgi:16S rRNA processing protein RimM
MKFFNVAKIVNTRGLRGELKVISYTDFPEERFKAGAELQIFKTEKDTTPLTTVTVKSAKPNKGTLIVTFEGMNNIDDVEKFKGMILKVEEEQLQNLDEGEFYIHEIVGLDVLENDVKIGTIKEVLSYGPNDVWVVKRPNENDLLLPYLKNVILSVDLEKGQVVVDVPEGLD